MSAGRGSTKYAGKIAKEGKRIGSKEGESVYMGLVRHRDDIVLGTVGRIGGHQDKRG